MPPPEVVDVPAEADEQTGVVRSNLAGGALLVRHEDGRDFRLSWEADDAREGARPLPAGQYEVRGYRRTQNDEHGVAWMMSATGQHLRRFEVQPGRVTEVPVSQAVTLSHKVQRHHGAFMIQMSFLGMKHAGVTLYRDGVRVPVAYSVKDGRGRSVAKGKIRYG